MILCVSSIFLIFFVQILILEFIVYLHLVVVCAFQIFIIFFFCLIILCLWEY